MIKTQWLQRHVHSCQSAMDADLSMAIELPDLERHLCLYEWTHPAISYGYTQSIPQDLNTSSLDSGRRATGGGIVFHNPGDLIFACAAPLSDPLFPKRLKHKMSTIRDLFIDVFLQFDIMLHSRENTDLDSQNTMFCSTYSNPYELFYNNQKILALTLRRFKSTLLIQGIIHLNNNYDNFDGFEHYQPFFSKGLSNKTINFNSTQSVCCNLVNTL